MHGDPTAALESVEQHVMGTLEEAQAEAEGAEAAAVPAEAQSGGPGGGPPAAHEVPAADPGATPGPGVSIVLPASIAQMSPEQLRALGAGLSGGGPLAAPPPTALAPSGAPNA